MVNFNVNRIERIWDTIALQRAYENDFIQFNCTAVYILIDVERNYNLLSSAVPFI